MIRDWPAIITIVFTLLAALVGGTMRFSSLETRMTTVEDVNHKLDVIDERLARIEGRVEEWKK